MVRSFPSDDRHRLVVLVAATLMVIGMICAPLAHADDDKLKKKERRVKQDISSAHQDLDESSAALRRAAARLTAARAQLTSARNELADTRGQLTTARVKDRAAQAALVKAVADLDTAKAELADGREAVEGQRVVVSNQLADNYEYGDPQLQQVSSILRAEDLDEVSRTLETTSAVVDEENGQLTDFTVAEVLLKVKKDNLADKRDSVKELREAAAANLRVKQELETRAEQQAASVRSLVGKRSSARSVASRVKARDLKELEKLEQEQNRIESMLKARAAAAAKKSGNSGPPTSSGGYLSYPVNGPVTSSYGYRVHPIYGYYSLHDGTDFGAGCGQPLYAAADGTVIESYYQTAWGNRLIIDNGHVRGVGLATIYNHATSYTVGVGSHVTRGQVIGYVGTTGWSTGCHLHFTVMVNGSPTDPMNWM
ncbi:M23 family metallopeptidase [Nocardioides sp. Root151]|uniref:M23 family metallopeptidase n=1 Tax=Nocardioides sp. Root151 TaxID=1736475 RepID=UPI000702B296|nr:M23 family metallopeptidase [Nocardioides sp. Root151]KQZ67422.1 hypothetical protein ASD66_20985 [Nocardioides sp. Root151]